MSEVKIPTEIVSSQIETPIDVASIVSSTREKPRKISARERKKFHAYDASKNCRDFGKEHKYVNRGSYDKCTKCGSSRTHRIAKTKVN